VPLRLEIGPKDLQNGTTLSVRRDTATKAPIARDALVEEVPKLLETIQNDMFVKARQAYHDRIKKVREWKDFVPTLDSLNVCLVPWCQNSDCEAEIKKKSKGAPQDPSVPEDEKAPSMGAKSLCIPAEQPSGEDAIKPGETKCVNCGRNAKCWGMFGRSY
jgi:prolyl-tRNA synthetase